LDTASDSGERIKLSLSADFPDTRLNGNVPMLLVRERGVFCNDPQNVGRNLIHLRFTHESVIVPRRLAFGNDTGLDGLRPLWEFSPADKKNVSLRDLVHHGLLVVSNVDDLGLLFAHLGVAAVLNAMVLAATGAGAIGTFGFPAGGGALDRALLGSVNRQIEPD